MDETAANDIEEGPPNESARPLPPPPDDPRSKDACQYAVDLSEKFLTLAVGGIAFIIGLVFAKTDSAVVQLSPSVLRWALVLFGLSVFLGWLFLMNVVGSVADGDYLVKNNAKQWLCLLQIVAALVGIGLLAYCTFGVIGEKAPKRSLCIVKRVRFFPLADGRPTFAIVPPDRHLARLVPPIASARSKRVVGD